MSIAAFYTSEKIIGSLVSSAVTDNMCRDVQYWYPTSGLCDDELVKHSTHPHFILIIVSMDFVLYVQWE